MAETGKQRLSLVDAEARRQARENLNDNLWVEAGAGTGKTTLLIDRLLQIILSETARLEEVVAITFTEKASAELKARLREKLEEMAMDQEKGQVELIHQALDQIESAPIKTIHSFAASLLRERPVEAGLDPRFTVTDSEEQEELLARVWEQWLNTELQNQAEPLRRALKLGYSIEQLVKLGDILYKNRDLVNDGEMPASAEASMESFLDELRVHRKELAGLLGDCRDQSDQGFQSLHALLVETGKLLAMEDQEEQERYLLHHLTKVSAKGNQGNWEPKDSCRRQKEICRDLSDSLSAARRKIAADMIADLTAWCRSGYLAAVEKKKQELGSLDFQDLLLRSRDLLRNNLEVRRYFQERYRYLLVDEFQDTDPLQVEIVFFLAEEAPLAEHWHDVKMKKGKLFLVGDPKQSIYRFRRADIEIYQVAASKILEGGQPLEITQNFRTVPRLIEWVNRSFGRIIRAQENYQPAYQSLSAYRDDPGNWSLVIPDPGETLEGLNADEIRAAEAEVVAGLIEEAVGKWTVCSENGKTRVLDYGDIALLFPTTTGIEYYEEALRRYGIPFLLEGGKKFYQRAEIVALKNLLNAVVNPYDRLAIIAVLHYWAGVTDQELYLFKTGGGHFNYLAGVENKHPRIEAMFAMLRENHHLQDELPPSVLAEKILRETWFWQRVILEPRSQQSLANLQKIIHLLRAREQEQPLTLKSFAYWLDRAWTGERDEEESLQHDILGNTVQILTVHRAKGLEFPAVFLLNSGGSRKKRVDFIADRARNYYYLNLGKDLESYLYSDALESEKLRLDAEQLRLFYVAATRARDYFVLPRFYSSRDKGFWASLDEDWNNNRDQWPGCLIIDLASTDLTVSSRRRKENEIKVRPEELLKQREIHLDGIRQAISEASSVSLYFSTGELTYLQEWGDEGEKTLQAAEQAYVSPGEGVSLGSAFHQVMEQIDLTSINPTAIDEAVKEAAHYWAIEDKTKLEKITEAALKHPLLDRACRASECYREVPFVYNLAGRVIEGIVDLLFIENGEIVIVDYKTDDVDAQRLEERWKRYRHQGEIYALAMAEITGLAVKEISFYFVRPGLVKTLSDPDIGQLKEIIIAIIENNKVL